MEINLFLCGANTLQLEAPPDAVVLSRGLAYCCLEVVPTLLMARSGLCCAHDPESLHFEHSPRLT